MRHGLDALGVVVVLAALASGGCDKLPGFSKKEQSGKPQSAVAAPAASAAAPGFAVAEHDRVALVNQSPLSVKDVELAVEELKQLAQAYGQEWKALSAEANADALDLVDILENLVVLELKAQDAKSRGDVFRKSEVQRRWAYLERNFYAREWDQLQEAQNRPSQEEITRFYEANKASLIEPERIHLRQIVTATLAEAEAARARVVSGELFQRVATEISIGPGKELGGDVGEFVRASQANLVDEKLAGKVNALFEQLESVAFALEPNQISQPVKDPGGRFVVAQLVDRTASRQKTLNDVEDGITRLLMLQKVEKQVEALRNKGQVREFPERLGAVGQ